MTEIKQKKAEDLQQLKKIHLPQRPRLTEKEARLLKKALRKKVSGDE
jgi:predicted DNA binding protein